MEKEIRKRRQWRVDIGEKTERNTRGQGMVRGNEETEGLVEEEQRNIYSGTWKEKQERGSNGE